MWANNPVKVLEGKPAEVERSVELYLHEGWREKARDWCAGMLQVVIERDPTRLENALARLDKAQHFTYEQKQELREILEELLPEEDEG